MTRFMLFKFCRSEIIKKFYCSHSSFLNYIINPILHRKWGNLQRPEGIYLETTNYCNARCYMCPNSQMQRSKGIMPWDLFIKIINDCKMFEGAGLNFYLHMCGEPLLDPFLFRRIRYLKDNLRKSKIHFNSNAAALNKANIENLLSSPLDSVIFSVDGASSETYEKIRVGVKYETVEKNLMDFFKLKGNLNRKLRVYMQMVVCQDNLHEINKYKELWGKKADRIILKPMHNYLIKNTSILTKEFKKRQGRICLQPFLIMIIYWNGDIGLCCWDYDNLCYLGNAEQDFLLSTYNNKRFKEIRKAMAGKDCKDIKPCHICSQIYGGDMYYPKNWAGNLSGKQRNLREFS